MHLQNGAVNGSDEVLGSYQNSIEDQQQRCQPRATRSRSHTATESLDSYSLGDDEDEELVMSDENLVPSESSGNSSS